jgi:CheY-like chemotaxis protein
MIFGSRKARRRILIVEDDWAVLEVLKLMLEDDGYVVVTVEQGRQALAAASAKPFDLILMDISMPGMSGIEVAQALRAQPETRDLLIAIHTGLDEHWVRERFVDYDLFLTKAADTDVLVDEIRKLFEQPRVPREQRRSEATASSFTMTEAIRAQQALRDAMNLGPQTLTMEALVGMLGDEIDQLRRLGEKDEQIFGRIEEAVGRPLLAASAPR